MVYCATWKYPLITDHCDNYAHPTLQKDELKKKKNSLVGGASKIQSTSTASYSPSKLVTPSGWPME